MIMSCVPLYHPLGLTLTTIMPLVEGIPIACHADPVDALGIAKWSPATTAPCCPRPRHAGPVCRREAIHPLMLASLRLVVSGAEALPDDVREQFELKFGKRIYEGWGMAETTTVATVNIPDAMDTSDWKVQQGNIPAPWACPLPGTALKIIDRASGQEQPLGSPGQLLVCGAR